MENSNDPTNHFSFPRRVRTRDDLLFYMYIVVTLLLSPSNHLQLHCVLYHRIQTPVASVFLSPYVSPIRTLHDQVYL